MAGSSTCKYCDRPIVWASTPRGSNLCLDPSPSPRGVYVLQATGTNNGRVLFAARQQRPDDAPGKRYTSHFDTCPKWRARAAGKEPG